MLSDRTILFEKLSQFIATSVLNQPGMMIAPNTPLLSGGVIDSFHLVDLAFFIENEFGVRLNDTELNIDYFDTLAELVAFIQQKSS